MYIPEGYGTVFPYMLVDRAAEFVDFLQHVFDANELGRTVFPDGRIANVRVKIGTSTFMISEAGAEMRAMPAAYYVYVEDVARVLEKAVAHGAIKLFDPTDMPYGDRQAGITDPCGNLWWISQRLSTEPYDAA